MSEGTKPKLIRADEAQVLLLDKMLQEIRRLESLAKAEVPEGVVEPIEKFNVTSIRTSIPRLKPWFSMSLINDGPNHVFVIVNTAKSFDEHEVHVGETYNIDMRHGLINDLLIWCRTGEHATIRLVGTR